jgi:hypothetical protein
MNRFFLLLVIFGCLVLHACSPGAKSTKSFDEIHRLVAGKTAGEVKKLLGPPNHVEKLLLGDERWVWWNYTYLAGESWAPEVRNKVVHLEITFENPSSDREGSTAEAKLEPRVSDPYGVGYLIPGSDESRASALNKTTRSGV